MALPIWLTVACFYDHARVRLTDGLLASVLSCARRLPAIIGLRGARSRAADRKQAGKSCRNTGHGNTPRRRDFAVSIYERRCSGRYEARRAFAHFGQPARAESQAARRGGQPQDLKQPPHPILHIAKRSLVDDRPHRFMLKSRYLRHSTHAGIVMPSHRVDQRMMAAAAAARASVGYDETPALSRLLSATSGNEVRRYQAAMMQAPRRCHDGHHAAKSPPAIPRARAI